MAFGGGGGEVEVDRVFIGAGFNRIVKNVSRGVWDLVAFGALNAVAILSPKSAQILTPGHYASVNCTHWLPSNKYAFRAKHLNCHYLLSADSDGAIHLWELSLLNQKWRNVLQLPKSHKKGITCITAHGSIYVWEGKLVASSCKAQTASVAEIWLWQVGSWKGTRSFAISQLKQ